MQVQKEIKEKAREVLKNYGLTLEEGIELFLAEVAETGKLPLKVPNETTRRVMEEVMRGENVEEVGIKEVTTICGKVIKIEGKDRFKAEIEVPGEGIVFVELAGEELARGLAQRLFEFVELEGELLWDPVLEKIIRFRAYDFKPFNPEKAEEVIEELSEEFGQYFNHIEDPVQYVKELRGGE